MLSAALKQLLSRVIYSEFEQGDGGGHLLHTAVEQRIRHITSGHKSEVAFGNHVGDLSSSSCMGRSLTYSHSLPHFRPHGGPDRLFGARLSSETKLFQTFKAHHAKLEGL